MSRTDAILRDGLALERLRAVVPAVLARLDDDDAWRGFYAGDPDGHGGERERLLCRDRIHDARRGRMWSVAVHRFAGAGAKTALHDHRYPLAVFPFGAVDGAALYEMPWERGDERGSVLVKDKAPWAIADHRGVRHAVHSLDVHYSVVLADVTDAPARADRLKVSALSTSELRIVRLAIKRALARALR